MHYEDALKNCIFRYLSGSHAYGMNTPESDQDFRGVFMAPLGNAFSLFQSSWIGQGTVGQHLNGALDAIVAGYPEKAADRIKLALDPEGCDLHWSGTDTVKKPGDDEELHELRKFLKLASACNPNIIEFLFIEKGVSHTTDVWELIRDRRELFVSKKARWTFAKYAMAQLRRIENHRRYLLHPPGDKPTRKAFGLSESSKIDEKYHGHILAMPTMYVEEKYKDEVHREKQYADAMKDWSAYEGWKTERNPKRRELEAKAGYDSKHASHLIRLLRMAEEILLRGEVIVYRPDREELLSIRQCHWTYEKVLAHINEMEVRIEDANAKSTLREEADYDAISDLYLRIAREHYGISI